MMRLREAPSAVRTAISRRRETPRASSRLATLTQAMSRTRPTAPSSSSNAGRILPVTWPWIGTTLALQPVLDAGLAAVRSAAICVISLWACASDTPLPNRPMAMRYRPRVRSGPLVKAHGHPQVHGGVQHREAGWHHTHHCPGQPADLHTAAHQAGVAAEAATPQPVADEGNVIARAIFFRRERPPDRGVDAEDLEQPSRHKLHRHLFGRAGLAESAVESERHRGQPCQAADRVFPVQEVGG